jgi:hypothetical protein
MLPRIANAPPGTAAWAVAEAQRAAGTTREMYPGGEETYPGRGSALPFALNRTRAFAPEAIGDRRTICIDQHLV